MRSDDSIVLVLAHELGAADLEHVERLANPPAEERRDLANRLRQRRAELLRRRDGVAAELRARYAMGGGLEVAALLDDLRALDRELSQCETAMDTIYGTLRPGAERRAARRTRDAALELSRLRLESARRSLLDAGVRRMPERIDLRRPRFGAVEGEQPGRILLTLRAAGSEVSRRSGGLAQGSFDFPGDGRDDRMNDPGQRQEQVPVGLGGGLHQARPRGPASAGLGRELLDRALFARVSKQAEDVEEVQCVGGRDLELDRFPAHAVDAVPIRDVAVGDAGSGKAGEDEGEESLVHGAGGWGGKEWMGSAQDSVSLRSESLEQRA